MTDLNIIVGVQSGDAIRQLSNVQKGVDNVGAATKRTTQQLKQHATQYNSTAVAANKFGKGALQQTGYQVADFAVQLQNGTSFLQAFGQQGSQLLAVFGPVGSVLGAVVAVGAALGTVFVKSTRATKDFSDGLTELKEETKKLNKEFEILTAGVKTYGQIAVLQKIQDLNKNILDLSTQMVDVAAKAASGHKRKLQILRGQVNELVRQRNEAEAILDNFNKINDSLDAIERASAFKEITSHIMKFGDGLDGLSRAFEPLGLTEGQRSAIARATNDILMFGDGLDTAVPPLTKAEIAVRDITKEIMMFGDGLDTLPAKLKDVSQEVINVTREIMMFGDGLDTLPDPFEKTRKSVADVTKEIMMFGDGLEDAFVVPEDEATSSISKMTEAIRNELSPEMQRMLDISESIGSSFESAMMSAVQGTMSVKDAFRAMAADIIRELYRVFVVKQVTGFISNAISLFSGGSFFGLGSASSRPPIDVRASGGPVSAGSPYLVGERGPELMIPNRSGTIIPNDKLGGGTIVVNQTINVSTGVQQTVRTEIKSLMPQIAESAKAAVADAKRRGGSYGRAFA